MIKSSTRLLAIATCVMAAALLVIGLWPLQFFPTNNIQWLPDRRGISLGGHGILFTIEPFRLERRGPRDSLKGPVSFEVRIEAHAETRNVAHILTVYGENNDEKFFVGQWESLLLLQGKESGATPSRKLGVAGELPLNEPRVVTITSSVAGTALYVNGTLKEFSRTQFLDWESLSGRLVLGDSDIGKNGWKGNLSGLAVYNHEITAAEADQHYRYWAAGDLSMLAHESGIIALYPFDEGTGNRLEDTVGGHPAIEIPSYFRVLNRRILVPPSKEFFPNWRDMAVNTAGFIPFGFLVCALLKNWKRYSLQGCAVWTLVAGALISLAIEVIQAYIPGRSSSLSDLLTNLLGAAIGVFLYRVVRVRTLEAFV